ncbi:hypothetical protein [Bradyrhizobium cenepequi]|jgi:hypothetical protein
MAQAAELRKMLTAGKESGSGKTTARVDRIVNVLAAKAWIRSLDLLE